MVSLGIRFGSSTRTVHVQQAFKQGVGNSINAKNIKLNIPSPIPKSRGQLDGYVFCHGIK